jgi:hypothetical protein
MRCFSNSVGQVRAQNLDKFWIGELLNGLTFSLPADEEAFKNPWPRNGEEEVRPIGNEVNRKLRKVE